MSKSYYTSTFTQLAPEKQAHILNVAIDHFAEHGFNGASINKIAREAGISIGALYSYFGSKKGLFLALAERGYAVLEQILFQQDFSGLTLEQLFTRLVNTTIQYSVENRRLTQIYLDLSTQGLSELAQDISIKLEGDTVVFYQHLFEQAQRAGEIASDVNLSNLAFFVDTILLSLQQAYASDYYRERMKLFMGAGIFDDEDRLVTQVVWALMKLAQPAQSELMD